jgi:uncharacterized protein YprB with RNaseH-like and TPR domain
VNPDKLKKFASQVHLSYHCFQNIRAKNKRQFPEPMASISEKLKSLGVKTGAQDLAPARPRNPYAIEQVLAGRPHATQIGETFLVEEYFQPEYRHGWNPLFNPAPLGGLAAWAAEHRIAQISLDRFAFLDTETTGLSGGTGTYPFLIGAGRFEGEAFHLAQFFLRDPAEEQAQLAALEEFLAPCEAIVTYNGKAFDVPIINTRFIFHGVRTPFLDTAHVDLLHLARRLWRDRLPSRTLGNLEIQILGLLRTEADVPGWMIPQMYFDYLRSGDARPLKSVFYHNAMDVVSLAALFNYTANLLDHPLTVPVEHGVDLVSLGKLFEDVGDLDLAIRLYLHGLDHDLPRENRIECIDRLAAIHKKQENLAAAVELWQQAASHQHIRAHIELAKLYEHRLRDYRQALDWTQSAIQLVLAAVTSAFERQQWLAELEHRQERLLRKISASGGLEPEAEDS